MDGWLCIYNTIFPFASLVQLCLDIVLLSEESDEIKSIYYLFSGVGEIKIRDRCLELFYNYKHK